MELTSPTSNHTPKKTEISLAEARDKLFAYIKTNGKH